MDKRENVIRGLECCSIGEDREPRWNHLTARNCGKCPYNKPGIACTRALAYDALELLKAQEPRVMTLEEVSTLPIDTPVFIEEINDECGWNVFYGIDEEKDVCFCGFKASADYYDLEEYSMSWRCWTSRPSDSERGDTPWAE